MRNLLAFLGGVIVTFLGMGWYLDWYRVVREPGATPGTSRVQIDINNDKIKADVSRGVERAKDLLENFEKKPAAASDTAPAAPALPAAPAGARIEILSPPSKERSERPTLPPAVPLTVPPSR
jgi:hypothetical protein